MCFLAARAGNMGYVPVYGTHQCTGVNNAEIKLSAFLSWLGMLLSVTASVGYKT